MTVDEWVRASAGQEDGVYVCLDCGEINTNYKYVCARCEAKTELHAEPLPADNATQAIGEEMERLAS